MTATRDDRIAELQRTIAELRQERDAALAQRNSEYGERIEQQAATIEVLKAMSATAGDEQPVLDLIARRARELCDAETVGIFSFDGEMISVRCVNSVDMRSLDPYLKTFPRAPARDYTIGRAVLDRQVIEIDDADADSNLASVVHHHRNRSIITLPFLVDDRVAGGMSIAVRKPGGLADSQKALARTLAEQASIAVGAAAIHRRLQDRTAALASRNTAFAEQIAHQSATIDVLKAMSASPGDPQPVFELIVRRAQELCNAMTAALYEYDGELVYLRSDHGNESSVAAAGITDHRSQFPMAPTRASIVCRAILDRQSIHIRDMRTEPGLLAVVRDLGHKSNLAIPFLRDGTALGAISLSLAEPGGFTDSQGELLKTFAEQAVIAIGSAETYRALHQRTGDLQESLEYQTATSEVLKVISRSTFDLQPVLDTVVETAARLCEADQAGIYLHQGDAYRWASGYSQLPEYELIEREVRIHPGTGTLVGRVALEGRSVQISDAWTDPQYEAKEDARVGAIHTLLGVPLLRDGAPIGVIGLGRQKIEPFTDRQIELVSTFADQAVIAIENTRLITEQREALEQQTATAEVLQVINASPGNLAPVFDTILEKAMRLCGAAFGCMYTYDGVRFPIAAMRGVPNALAHFISTQPPLLPSPGGKVERVLATKRAVQILDLAADDMYLTGDIDVHAYVDLGGARTIVDWPLLREGSVVGLIAIYREEVRAFSEREVALLENFAAQAVIAMESARLLNALRARTDELSQRQAELQVTFENMGDGVAMFDQTQHLVAWNRKFQDILDVPDDIIARRQTFSEYVRYLADRGEYGSEADSEEQVRRLIEQAGQARTYERTRPDGRVIEIRHNPVAGGGFVLIYADITERKRNEAEIRAARDAAEEASRTIEAAYRDLKAAQANLIQAEKMASLGQLTAGIAHEIKNPLNFVNNFAALSVDLLSELKETAAPGFAALTDDQRADIEDVSGMLTSNLEKITEHGKRADGIVKAMLEHSRGSSAERRMVDLNAVIDEALNLAYHGARAQDQSFNITLERDFGGDIAPIEVNSQDMTRVFLNIFSNGFYAATRRARNGGDAGFLPMLKVTTRDAGEVVDIRVRDNGTGIPAEIRDKLFQPFFTTKPTGEGTGLGLSITYDIVTKQHGGSIAVDSKVGEYSEFTIRLPRTIAFDSTPQ